MYSSQLSLLKTLLDGRENKVVLAYVEGISTPNGFYRRPQNIYKV
jgi:hypothetical protein